MYRQHILPWEKEVSSSNMPEKLIFQFSGGIYDSVSLLEVLQNLLQDSYCT